MVYQKSSRIADSTKGVGETRDTAEASRVRPIEAAVGGRAVRAYTARTMRARVEVAEALLEAAQEAEQQASEFLPCVPLQDGRGAEQQTDHVEGAQRLVHTAFGVLRHRCFLAR